MASEGFPKPKPPPVMRSYQTMVSEFQGGFSLTVYLHDKHGRSWTVQIPVDAPTLSLGEPFLEEEMVEDAE